MASRHTAPHAHSRLALLASACLALGASVGSCGKDDAPRPIAAPKEGVVGRVTALQGEVTWSLRADGPRTPLAVGAEVLAEWTVHTAPGASLSVRLRNGHLWTLSGDVSKRVSTVAALTLPPAREGALGWVADLGGKKGSDRTSAAGLYHERQIGTKASPTQGDALDTETAGGEAAAKREQKNLEEKDPAPQPAADKTTPAETPGPTTSEPPAPRLTGPSRRTASARTTAPKPAPFKAKSSARGLLRASDPWSGRSRKTGAQAGAGGTPAGGGPKAAHDGDQVTQPPTRAPVPKTPGKSPTSAPAHAETAPGPTATPKPDRATTTTKTLPEAPDRGALNAAMATERSRLVEVMKKQGLRGTHLVKLQVAAISGRVVSVTVGSRGPNDSLSQAVLRALRGVTLPKVRKPYSFSISIVVP